jgi:hypothetical protein
MKPVGVVRNWKLIIERASGYRIELYHTWDEATAAWKEAKATKPLRASVYACRKGNDLITWDYWAPRKPMYPSAED